MVDVAVVTCLIILSVSVTFLNIGCLYLMFSTCQQRRTAATLIASLLVAHMIQGIVVMPLYTIKRWDITNKLAKTIVCDTFLFSYLFTNYVSCIAVLLISLDRFLAIIAPFKYRVRATTSSAKKAIIGSWIYVLILCLIPFASDHKKCHYNPSRDWTILMLLGNTALPFVTITAVYSVICRKSRQFLRNRERRRSQQLSPEQITNRRTLRVILTKELAAVKVAFIITICYIICWGPSFMYYLLRKLCPKCYPDNFEDSPTEKRLGYAMKFLTMIDGIVAPVVYCLFDRNLRKAVARKQSNNRARRLTEESVFKSKNGTSDSALCTPNRQRSFVSSAAGSPEHTDIHAAPYSKRLILPENSWPLLADPSNDAMHSCKHSISDASQSGTSGSKAGKLFNRHGASKRLSPEPEPVKSKAYELRVNDGVFECAQSVSQELQLLKEDTGV